MNRTLVIGVTALTLGVLTLGGLTGCGPENQDQAKASPSASPSPSAAPSSPPPSSPGDGGAKTPRKDSTMELKGTVEKGVEAACFILTVGGKTYSLIGGDRDVIKAGARVVVRGTEEPDMVTTCQQGVPFKVAEARKQ